MKTFASIVCICVLCCAAATGDDGARLAALQKRIDRLEEGIRGVEAIRAVKRLSMLTGTTPSSVFGMISRTCSRKMESAIIRPASSAKKPSASYFSRTSAKEKSV